MTTNKERLRFAAQQLREGRYRELAQLVARKLGMGRDRDKQPASRFHSHKSQAIQGFLDFVHGGEQPSWPLEVFIEVSNLCDLQCAMCHTFSALNPKRFNLISHRHRGFFDVDLIEERMGKVLEHALVVHAFGYGEPTLHPKFERILDILDRYEVMVDFFTNGMHLDAATCEDLVSKRISKITISFSGSDREHYENIYIGGNFDQVLAGIRQLHAEKQKQKTDFPLIVINSLAFRHQVEKLPAFVRMMGEAGANVIHLKPFKTYDMIPELHGHASVFHPEQEGAILEQARGVAAEYGLRLETGDYESHQDDEAVLQSRHMGSRPLSRQTIPIGELKNLAREKRDRDGLGEKAAGKIEVQVPQVDEVNYRQHDGMYCLEPFKTLYFSYEGSAHPCCYKGVTWGDIGKNPAHEIWQSDLMHSLRQHVARQEYPVDLCHGCIRTGLYPRANAARMYSNHYARWYEERFGQPFAPELIQAMKQLPDSQELFQEMLLPLRQE
ncbi:radical SAM protein [Thiolapillus brandeum]|nr:radical SAM protein [Thiolapillus brandeum]